MKLNEIICNDIYDIKTQLDQMLELSHLVFDNPNYGAVIVVDIGDYKVTPNNGEADRFKHYQALSTKVECAYRCLSDRIIR